MVEASITFDMLPNVDLTAYAAWGKKAIEACRKARGFVEGRANRSLLGPAQVRIASSWQTVADWGNFTQGAWGPLDVELRSYATNIKSELWGPSPLTPEPFRP
jgi:hypothetical protein